MRKTVIAAVTGLSLLLGACSTVQVTNFLGQVQAVTAQACLFVPTIDTILAVASALGIPATGIVGGAIDVVARAICAQVPPPASAKYRALAPEGGGPARIVGNVGGVPVTGWRTR